MLGLLFIYFVGKQFYELAKEFNKNNKWLYAVLGVISYYGGGFLIVLGLMFLGYFFVPEFVESLSETVIGLIMIPCGIFACWIFHYLLKKNWQRNLPIEPESIENIGLEQ